MSAETGVLVGIHQPHYLPWLRYFEKVARSDVFIVLDTVQFSKNGWQNRNKVKTPQGAQILTTPVHAHLDRPLVQIQIDRNQPWRKKHLQTILQSYRRAPYMDSIAPFLESTYVREWDTLCALNRVMLDYFLDTLEIRTPVYFASELDVPGTATERLINLIKAVGGTRYYSGAYALDAYLDAKKLDAAGIELVLQEWSAPTYPQLYGEFIPDLSIVDLLANCGPAARDVLLGVPT